MATTYPIYRKDGCHFWKVYSDSEAIGLLLTSWGLKIHTVHKQNAYMPTSKDCTESEFIDAYNKVKNKLEDLVLKS